MTKWIEQMAKNHGLASDNPADQSWAEMDFMSGATAMRDKVMELIENTKENAAPDTQMDYKMLNLGRESLRQELKKALEGL